MAAEDEGWIPVVGRAELSEGKPVRVEAFGIDVFVLRSGDAIYAIANRCTHQGAPLHRGIAKVLGSDPTVTCAAHGSMVSLVDGRVHRGPAAQPLAAFDARVNGETIELRPKG